MTIAYLDLTGAGATFEDDELVTITITLPSALTDATAFTLLEKSSIEDANGEITGSDGMTLTSTIVTPYEEEQDSVAEFDFDEVVGSDGVSAIEDADESSEVGLVITFYDEEGNEYDAVYGTDFVLKDSDGNILTKTQYTNVIGGYDADTLDDLIAGGTLVIYNDEIASVVTKVVAWGDAEDGEAPILATNEVTVSEDSNSSSSTKTPKITLTVSPTTVYVGDKVTVTATVKYYTDDGEVTIYTDDDSLDHMTASGLKAGTSTNQKATATFTAALKGTATIYAVYTYTDDEGETQVSDIAEKDITIKTESSSSSSSSGGSSSSSSSGSGDVASGNYSNNATINYTASFSDLDDVSWAQEAIYGLASKNVISGYEDGTFRPNNNITRAEFAKLLVLTFGYGSFTGASANFSDVPTTHWAYDYVAIAYTLGAITGYDADTFGPDDNITREQMATMIYRLVKNYDVTLTLVEDAITFDDDWAISDYARESVTMLQQADVINGMGDGTFAPQDSATRAQAAVMLYKFVN
ncbi:MAG: S-layer homology domain-containing protein [Firmicutes bacterium]|nr:S-layer homology domain-containing protein [Bacillota bacterium]